MKDKKDIAVIIQARLGSQRVPNKMIKQFHNTTLLDIALEKIKLINPVHHLNLNLQTKKDLI